ncbi:AfsR/SARP family transcriptional regulator [Nonomuraea phyllanthi]|uniref:AfsR/SARP family transcriptional regulator n=1 Tax=Nonomuraea phyllanthi TaxID=2219224 RepID=UPI0021D56EC5|nr:BTAD domain-containing putative transcriptional regulator [Nonomuraea phyllanthi]
MLISALAAGWTRARIRRNSTVAVAEARPHEAVSMHRNVATLNAPETTAIYVEPADASLDVGESVRAEAEPLPPELPMAPASVTASRAMAKVEVLGAVRVTVAGKEVSFGRAEGRALFALLATSKEGELSESAIERLWPDDGERGIRRLETAVRDVNGSMRHATGLGAEVKFVVKAGMRRKLSAAYFDVDWWRFEEAYVEANSADSEPARRRALWRMLDLYQGPLLADRKDLWCLPRRQAATTQAVSAVLRLAELERKDDPDRALGALTLAVDRIDTYNEVLWRQIMTIQGELGRLPALELTLQQLTERLREIEAQPSPQTRQLYQRFINQSRF